MQPSHWYCCIPKLGAFKGYWKVLPPPCLSQSDEKTIERQKKVEFRGGERLPPKFINLPVSQYRGKISPQS